LGAGVGSAGAGIGTAAGGSGGATTGSCLGSGSGAAAEGGAIAIAGAGSAGGSGASVAGGAAVSACADGATAGATAVLAEAADGSAFEEDVGVVVAVLPAFIAAIFSATELPFAEVTGPGAGVEGVPVCACKEAILSDTLLLRTGVSVGVAAAEGVDGALLPCMAAILSATLVLRTGVSVGAAADEAEGVDIGSLADVCGVAGCLREEILPAMASRCGVDCGPAAGAGAGAGAGVGAAAGAVSPPDDFFSIAILSLIDNPSVDMYDTTYQTLSSL
jgi:hypothetical protein